MVQFSFPTYNLVSKFQNYYCDDNEALRLANVVVSKLEIAFNVNVLYINNKNSIQDLADRILNDYEMELCDLLGLGNVVSASAREVWTQGDVDYNTITGCLSKEYIHSYIAEVLKEYLSKC